MTPTDTRAYVARIYYEGLLHSDETTLRGLHRAHLLAVPFENLDIHLGREIVPDETLLFDNIVNRRRGWFCYELNGLFAALLRDLDFDVTLLSARVMRGDGSFGPEFDHLLLRVDLYEPWLADVGFGDLCMEPIRLTFDEQERDGNRVRISEHPEGLLLERTANGDWAAKYLFTLQPRSLTDFAEMCRYHQTSPESPFTRNRVCSLPTVDGRISLSGNRLIVTHDGEREERELTDEDELSEVVRRLFGVQL